MDTLRKEYRSKTLLVLFVFTILVVVVSRSLLDFISSASQEGGTTGMAAQGLGLFSLNIFYTFIDMWSVLVASIIGVNTLKTDLDHKVGIQLLSFPIRRKTYLFSRLLGSWFIVSCYYIFSLLFAGALFSLSSETFLVGGQFLVALLNSSLIVLSTLIFAMAFSMVLPRFMALIANFMFMGLISLSNGAFLQKSLREAVAGLDLGSGLLYIVYWIFPRYANLNSFTNRVLFDSKSLDMGNYLFTVGHFLLFAFLWAWIFSYFFERRDL